jgi:hypothetical protein
MNIEGSSPAAQLSNVKAAETLQSAEVAVIKKQQNQTEAITSKLIEGIEENPQPRSGAFPTGQKLDVSA